MATDITAQSGKGPRAHRNVSNTKYRAGWDYIFARRPRKVNKVSSGVVKNVLTDNPADVKQQAQ